jgi:hypothetical protein
VVTLRREEERVIVNDLGVLFGSDEKSVKLYISDGCTTLNSAPKY